MTRHPDEPDMQLWDIRLVVDRIEGRSVCGMAVGDSCEVVDSSRLVLPEGGHFCIYALQAALPLIPAKQRDLPANDWLERDTEVACPDPEERLVMRIERTRRVGLRSEDLT
ncbi:TIGR04076 family protein [Homoserinibacter sp. GY 40078]|uniref:TIGR04076 family protein n=1 Tax=Homoserinibacter sp. GY 40078 TaxID=2603275 RepID=UPI0011C97566|nr:TIGR04076 family protein [Homoserinibacter sp. GY 40078]TXK19844.1 TIGR04076 family protein [Homoserinibacter sp. GY 40078]